MKRVLLVALVALALGLAGAGCGPRDDADAVGGDDSSTVATASPSAESSPGVAQGGASTDAAGASGAGASGAGSAEAASIERELETITRELDALSMPDDSDFQAIEDALD